MSLLEEFRKRRPTSRIFHYTSQAGLVGIVKSKCIWATSIHHLNDATEFDYARGLLKRVIGEKSQDGVGTRLVRELNKLIVGSARINLFVTSFSEKPDLLSQWRAYCPNGNGYSIGFKYAQLADQMSRQKFFLAPCIYDPVEQEKLIRELVDQAFTRARAVASPKITEIANECLDKFFIVGPTLKHPSFAEEVEWRLISEYPKFVGEPQIAVREGKSILLPYFQFRLAEENAHLPKPRIVVGPNPHMELAILSVQFLMGTFQADVRPTTIPYRAW